MSTIHHVDSLWVGYVDMNLYMGCLDHDLLGGASEERHFISQDLQMQSVCAHLYFSVGKSLYLSVQVSVCNVVLKYQ